MDFNLDPRNESYRKRIRDFVEQELLPLEQNPEAYDEHENIATDYLEKMRAKAKQQGLWCLQIPERLGGQGLDISGMAACYEEMNRSIFGPVVFNSAAPDDGNMTVLAKVGTEAQQERWLKPIVEGRVRSSFVMTEPPPGCGSDPGMMQTTATRKGDRWVIHGHKHFITGAAEASHFILIARTSEDTRKGLSAFLFHKDDPGWEIIRRIPIMGPEEHGGHCELRFDGLEIPDENRLMEVGDGLKVTRFDWARPVLPTACDGWAWRDAPWRLPLTMWITGNPLVSPWRNAKGCSGCWERRQWRFRSADY